MDWPDWSGATVIVVGTGPSVKDVDLAAAKGKAKIFVIKGEYRYAPWADALYGIDRAWWIANRGAADFNGLKFSPSPTVCRVFTDVRQVRLRPLAEILMKEAGVIGCGLRTGGGYSGFQAINLAAQFGARRVLLVGFDMTAAGRRDPHEAGVAKFDADRVAQWRKSFDAAAPQFAALGIEVVNCSAVSALTSYRKARLEDVI